jgi:hypothetical protein
LAARPSSDTPYQFALPPSYLRLIAFVDEDGDAIQYAYRRDISRAIKDAGDPQRSDALPMRFLALLTNVGLWPGWFSKMVYLNIAHKICKPLTRDIRQKVDIANRLEDAYSKAGNNGWRTWMRRQQRQSRPGTWTFERGDEGRCGRRAVFRSVSI